jgi:hypothetical protein
MFIHFLLDQKTNQKSQDCLRILWHSISLLAIHFALMQNEPKNQNDLLGNR